MNIAHFSVLRHQPYPQRTEHVNIGIAAFLSDGTVRVRLASNLRKLRALDPRASMSAARSQEEHLRKMLEELRADGGDAMNLSIGPWRLGGATGTFCYQSEHEIERSIEWALRESCDPRDGARPLDRPAVSRLYTDLKRTFSANGWLGKRPEQIADHLIIPRYSIIPEEGLVADFALRNGSLHVLEALDLRGVEANIAAKRTEGQAKAMVLTSAQLADASAKTYAVVAGSNDSRAAGTMRLLERLADDIYAWESGDDMSKLFDRLSAAMGRQSMPLPPMS